MNEVPYSKTPAILPFSEGLELLGLKWLPYLTPTQAKEVTPWEVGDRQWRESLHTLSTGTVYLPNTSLVSYCYYMFKGKEGAGGL